MTAEQAIRSAIADHGPITFARFMELAQYGPDGYYSSGSPVSATGDFYTSPTAHPLFGWLLAVQLEEMWQLLGSPGKFTIVEHGASTGVLAADITDASLALSSDFAAAVEYKAFDIAPPANQHYPVSPLADDPSGVTGCLLSNELLDAMPVHRFEIRDKQVMEIFVGLEGDKLVAVLGEPSNHEIRQIWAQNRHFLT